MKTFILRPEVPRGRLLRKHIIPILQSLSGVIMLLLLWKLIALAAGSGFLMPPPESAAYRLLQLLPQKDFWAALGATALRALYGFGISFILALALGATAGLSPFCRRFISPLLTALRTVPVLSVILLAMLWFKTNTVPIFASFLMIFPLVSANVLQGVEQVDERLVSMGRLYRLDARQRFAHIILPSLLPFLLAAANAGIGMAWKVSIAAEILCQPRHAIGTGIRYAQLNLEIAEMMAWTAAAILLSALTETLFNRLKRLFPWQPQPL
ncbi:MAG: hypothetical protein B0D92_03890 [Spirochaeta sp. LUC14_002_19_P3]|nr:MAG: hypothetical protein B0D92_03890 [Spirochaeta sp. LUC14_002_19_P3]